MADVKAGMRVGIPLAVISLVITALYDAGHLPSWMQAVEFLVALVGFVIAGRIAGRQTGRARHGAVAGAITSLFPSVVVLGANVVMAAIAPTAFAHAFDYHDMSSGALLLASIARSFMGLVVWAIFGLLFGVLGGLLGSKQHATESVEVPTAVTR